MFASFTAGVQYPRGDVDQDGVVGIGDVTCLVDYLLTGIWDDDPVNPDEPITETFTVNGVSFTMVGVEGGTFTMGATEEQGSDATDREKPAHEVTLSSFCIGETEVTQELWQAVMGANPSYYEGDLQRPVEQVSWNDCQEFIAKLNQLTGKNFRLPTEAEWEYAARGGKSSLGYKYAGSNNIDEVAWYGYNNISTHPVATKAPNELGLYDMSGNVWELCQDYFIYNYYSNSPTVDPTGPLSGSSYLRRGGGTGGDALTCRVSGRYVSFPESTSSVVGLRLAIDAENSNKFRLSETVVSVSIGESKMVEILNGDGNYDVEGGSNYLTSTIDGNSLTVTGVNVGTTTVHVTNTTTGAITILTVIVTYSQTFTVNGVSFTMIPVEGGTFTMGATPEQGSDAYYNENPAHEVTLSDYSMGETEVTQALWQAVMGSNPSYFSPYSNYDENLQRPVEFVSWDDCQTFISKLNQMTGKTFRLPTEAEWEFAARGGNLSQGYKYAGSDSINYVAWYWFNIPSQTIGTEGYGTQMVASLDPNELGLYDMSGNVWEWCQDWYGSYSSEPQTNPTGPASGTYRIYRGGCWGTYDTTSRVSYRGQSAPTNTLYSVGFRLAL